MRSVQFKSPRPVDLLELVTALGNHVAQYFGTAVAAMDEAEQAHGNVAVECIHFGRGGNYRCAGA